MRTIGSTRKPCPDAVCPSCESVMESVVRAVTEGLPVDICCVLPDRVRHDDFWKTDLLAGLFMQVIVKTAVDEGTDVLPEYMQPGDAVDKCLGFVCCEDDWDVVFDDFIAFSTTHFELGTGFASFVAAVVDKYSVPSMVEFWTSDALGKIVAGLAAFHMCTTYMQLPMGDAGEDLGESDGFEDDGLNEETAAGY